MSIQVAALALLITLPGIVVGVRLVGSSPVGHPTWSPDGLRIAYQCSDWICLTSSDGRRPVRLVRGANPDWSPDGQSILYECANPPGEICVLDVAARKAVDITVGRSSGSKHGRPRWSPDGHHVVMEEVDAAKETTAICTMAVGGAEGEEDLTDAGDATAPAWSPDGNRIAYVSGRQLVAVSSDGDEEQTFVFTPTLTAITDPVWSPDGRRIAFSNSAAIWVLDTEDRVATRLTSGMDALCHSPAWSPNGARIAFQLETLVSIPLLGVLHRYSICVINADGTGLTILL